MEKGEKNLFMLILLTCDVSYLGGDDGYCTGGDGKERGCVMDEFCEVEAAAEVHVDGEDDTEEAHEGRTPGDERYRKEHLSVLHWEPVQEPVMSNR